MQDHFDSTLRLRTALFNLQKELLSHLKENFEKESGRSVSPGEWLQVIMVAQRYHWLRELTSLMADIDILTEIQGFTPEQASLARAEVERLFFKMDTSSDFNKNYQQLMMAGAPLMMSHGHLRDSTNKLPPLAKPITREETHEARKSWHKVHHEQSRSKRKP
ncbi:MAG: hypothetical protein ACXWRE_00295 [Pseudobdellovibrionaceae bacterium]